MNKAPKIYADSIVDFLIHHQITHVFDLTGGMIAFLEDAISRAKGINCIPMHHEQAAGFAAEGFARVSGRFGVAMATSGPGAINLMTAIGSCYFDSVPALFITGQVHTNNIKKNDLVRQEGFQETDIVSMVRPITKYASLVTDEKKILPELEKAVAIMKDGRPGPVLIDIPINLQRTLHTDVTEKWSSKQSVVKKLPRVKTEDVKQFKKMLLDAKAPLLFVGHGVRIAEATKALKHFQKQNSVPVVSSLLGLDVFPAGEAHLGYIGSNGNRVPNIALANADLVIVIGSRLDIRQTGDPAFFNHSAKIVHIDIDGATLNYSIKADLSFLCDAETFLKAVADIKTPKKVKWWHYLHQLKVNFSRVEAKTNFINPNYFFEKLSQKANKDSLVTVDVGQNQQWLAQSWQVKNSQRVLFSGGMGAMGFALPAGIGAWFAEKNRTTIVVTGDGGFQINIQELETVARNKIPLKIFVLNNTSLGMVREFQDTYLKQNNYTTVEGYGNPDFKKLANAYGIPYAQIKKSAHVKNLENILSQKGPMLIEVCVDQNAPLHPKIVYGHALDDQSPYLNSDQKTLLESLKAELYSS